MTDGPQIRINMRGKSKDSPTGHVTATLAFSAKDKGKTYGATVKNQALLRGLIYKTLGPKDDGIIRDESKDMESDKYTWVTRAVPVTEGQLRAIAKRLEALEGKTYNYYARPGLGEEPQACTTFAKAILRMTGHDIELGDLFSIEDRKKVPGIVWHEISGNARPESVARKYRPTEPNIGHYPDVGDIGIRLNEDRHQYGGGVEEADQGFGELFKSPKVREFIGLRRLFGPLSSVDLPGRKVPETILGAAQNREHQMDEGEFERNTILTRRRRRKKTERFTDSSRLASAAPRKIDGSRMFPNSDHN